jgi:spore coat protein W
MANKNLEEASSSILQLFVQDILQKNGVTKENRMSLSDEQKTQLKKVVTDLQEQVDEFVKGKEKSVKQTEEIDDKMRMTLREMIKKRKNS